MKKILGLLFLVSVSICSYGQTSSGQVGATTTITNTTYAYINQTLNSGVGGKVSYQIIATRTSGTTTGGVRLEQSNDGVSWSALTGADTLAITNTASAQSKQFTVDIPASRLVRARGQLAGTGVYTFKLYANYRYNAKP